MDPSPAVEESIKHWARHLDHRFERIERCAVVVELPHGRHRQGMPFQVHVYVTIPDRTIAITRDSGIDDVHEDIYIAIADAFRAARRQLQDCTQIHRGDTTLHA